jgi:hypothetical protein
MTKIFLLAFLFMLCIDLFAQTHTYTSETRTIYIQSGIGFGSMIAIVASWSRNQSIFFAILHGILSWFYVIYFVFTRIDKPIN